eukprot:TRINITY_DN28406_c0_g1_i1.p2 TRINITY_DN28406_c0_g1~~TRINITY_DN28406_c0_g1_i1.p2  ORF type:complete len:129 (+),score=7.82 TRINITY_DN28406_c0_g1_i1:381-767(+)
MQATEHMSASATETCQSDLLPAGRTPVRRLPRRLRHQRLLTRNGAGRRRRSGSFFVQSKSRNGVRSESGRGITAGLRKRVFQVAVAFGAKIHGRRAAKEAAVIGAKDEALGYLAPSLFLVSVPALLCH